MSLSLRSFLMNSNYLRIHPAAPLFPASDADVSVKATGGMESTKSITMAKRGRKSASMDWISHGKSTENHGFWHVLHVFTPTSPQKKSRADLFSPNVHWIRKSRGPETKEFPADCPFNFWDCMMRCFFQTWPWFEHQLGWKISCKYAAIVGRSDVIKLVKYIILGDQKAMHPIYKMSCQQHFRSTRCLPATKRGRFLLEMTVGHPQVEVQSLVINN